MKSEEMHKCLSRWKIENKVGYKIRGKKMGKFEIAFWQNGENSQSRVCGSLTLDRAVFTFLIIVCGNQFYEML